MVTTRHSHHISRLQHGRCLRSGTVVAASWHRRERRRAAALLQQAVRAPIQGGTQECHAGEKQTGNGPTSMNQVASSATDHPIFTLATTLPQPPTTCVDDTMRQRQLHLGNASAATIGNGDITKTATLAPDKGPGHNDTNEIGAPADQIWDFVGAFEHRFCYCHGQTEWLLRAGDRWMRPDDFSVQNAHQKLERQALRFQQDPSRISKKNAECDSTLWSQVDTAVEVDQNNGMATFKIRWKLQWIPESDIDDLGWVHRSYASGCKGLGLKRSGRNGGVPKGLTPRRAATMRVIEID